MRYKAVILITLFCLNTAAAQTIDFKSIERSLNSYPADKQNSTLPIAFGVAAVLYLLNPIFQYENDKLVTGLTKEFSVGFGEFGEHRVAVEYSQMFKENQKSNFRFSYKYDILLKPEIEPSNNVQGTSVLSLGAGYYTDFDGGGIFPEVTYGYSLRNDKILFYPHVKARHTFMVNKGKASITDISFGIILGIANPFADLKIRRRYN